VGGTTTRDIPLARIKEYFAGANYGVVEAQGFINIDGSFYMENFNRAAPAVSANQTGSSRVIGDTGAWAFQERGTGGTVTNATFGCSATPGSTDTSNAVNGVLAIALETSTNTNGTNLTPPWCYISMSSATGAGSVVPVLKAANKFIMYYKVKMSSAYTNSVTGNMMWFGADNQTNGGWIGKPTFTGTSTGGIWITNVDGTQTVTGTNATAGTQWVGWSRYNGSDSTVACSGFNPSSNTSNYALFRIEVRDTNDAQFFIDGDTSNGVAMTSCGQVTSNIPTAPIRPAMNLGRPYINTSGTVWTAYVDLFAYVQDDPRGVVAPNGLSQVDAPEPTFNPITGADVAEQYRFSESDDVSAGDIVSLGDVVGDGDKATRPYDRKMYGVVSESPGMVLGDSAVNSLPVAISGRVPVKVTAKNGAIKIGDPITSSDIPGVGMRATQSGKILGTAMENYSKDEVGKILVSINPGYYINDGHDVAMVENDPEMVLGASASATISDNALGLSIQASSSARPTAPVTESSSVGQIADKMFMFKNGLRVDKVFESLSDAIFYGKTRFQGAVEFVSSTIFRSDVEFEGSVTFNSNTAGYAKIKRGQRFVNVTFDQEYKNQPVVQVSPNIFKLTDATFQDVVAQGFCTELEGIEACQDKLVDTILNSGVNYAVQNQTTQGFLIVLDQNAPVDLTFSWQAIAVKTPKTATNSGPSDLVMPYRGNYQISNRFGEKSNDPAIQAKDEKNGLKGHDGYDISMPEGTPIVAVDDGVVEIQNDDYGTTLVLKHSWGKTVYGHLSKTLVTVGQKVSRGQQIALSGNTGLSTGPHLHFGMKVDAASVAGGYNGFVNPSLYFAFDSHKSGPAVAGISVHLDSSISASSSSLLHHEDERAASSSSATEPGKDAADLLSGEEVSKRAETN
jgi:murein DD-endopeptidase MepM/ murein hydrolase activator NlpD